MTFLATFHWGWLLATFLLGFGMGWIAVVHRGHGVSKLLARWLSVLARRSWAPRSRMSFPAGRGIGWTLAF